MIKVLNSYIFKQTFILQLIFTVALLAFAMLIFSFRFFKYINLYGATVKIFGELILYKMPEMTPMLFPLTISISIIIIYNKLYVDSEINAIRSSGISNFQLIKPFFLVGFLMSLFSAFIAYYYTPVTLQKFDQVRSALKKNIDHKLLSEGVFYNLQDDLTAYIHERDENGIPSGIYIEDQTDSTKSQTITAQKALIKPNEKGFQLLLKNGFRVEYSFETNEKTILQFDKMSIDLDLIDSLDVSEKPIMFIPQLLGWDKNVVLTGKKKIKSWIEGHTTILAPFLIFSTTFIVLIIMLAGEYSRLGLWKKNLLAVISVITFYGMFFIFKNMSYNFEITIYLMYLMTIAPILYFFFFLIDSNLKGHVK